jgi:hypothetical protein
MPMHTIPNDVMSEGDIENENIWKTILKLKKRKMVPAMEGSKTEPRPLWAEVNNSPHIESAPIPLSLENPLQ